MNVDSTSSQVCVYDLTLRSRLVARLDCLSDSNAEKSKPVIDTYVLILIIVGLMILVAVAMILITVIAVTLARRRTGQLVSVQ